MKDSLVSSLKACLAEGKKIASLFLWLALTKVKYYQRKKSRGEEGATLKRSQGGARPGCGPGDIYVEPVAT
jgi:hypothetical protein